MKKILTIFLTIFLFGNNSFAQNHNKNTSPFILGDIDKIQSTVLGETRILNIYLPAGYSPDSATAYPVIYLLDGSANEDFIHIAGIVQFLTMIDAMPKSIVVGIANIDRRRDFTFPTTIEKDKKDYPTTGSSQKFIEFIEKELQPFIEKKYKTNNSKTIIGQSLGGLLATEILLKKPGLFDNYIIVSPSLWWDKESLLAAAPAILKTELDVKVNAFIFTGNEGEQMESDAKRLVKILQASGRRNLTASFKFLPDENHLTILHNCVYKALVMLYNKKKAE